MERLAVLTVQWTWEQVPLQARARAAVWSEIFRFVFWDSIHPFNSTLGICAVYSFTGFTGLVYTGLVTVQRHHGTVKEKSADLGEEWAPALCCDSSQHPHHPSGLQPPNRQGRGFHP